MDATISLRGARLRNLAASKCSFPLRGGGRHRSNLAWLHVGPFLLSTLSNRYHVGHFFEHYLFYHSIQLQKYEPSWLYGNAILPWILLRQPSSLNCHLGVGRPGQGASRKTSNFNNHWYHWWYWYLWLRFGLVFAWCYNTKFWLVLRLYPHTRYCHNFVTDSIRPGLHKRNKRDQADP